MKEKKIKQNSPGVQIQKLLDQNKWNQDDLAYVMDVSPKHVNQIIRDKQPLSIEICELLSAVFPTVTTNEWRELDLQYRKNESESIVSKKQDAGLKAKIFQYIPANELMKKGWIEKTNDINKLTEELKDFLGTQNLNFSFFEQKQDLYYRKSDKYSEYNDYAAKTWYKMALNKSNCIKVSNYSQSNLTTLFDKIHEYTTRSEGVGEFLEDLNDCGVKFIFLSHLSKTYLDGAAFWDDTNPVVGYTGRYDRLDNFWFTIAHEIAHVLKHIKKGSQPYFDVSNGEIGHEDNFEREANDLAGEKLLQNKILEYFEEYKHYLTVDKVFSFSNENKLHPSITAGVLAHHDIISYTNIHKFKDSIIDKIPTKYKVELQ